MPRCRAARRQHLRAHTSEKLPAPKLAPRTQISTSHPRSRVRQGAAVRALQTRAQPRAGCALKATELCPWLCPFPDGTDKARDEGQVSGGTVRLSQGRTEGVGAEGDKRNERARPPASHQPLPGDSTKMPIDGISSRTERPGSRSPASIHRQLVQTAGTEQPLLHLPPEPHRVGLSRLPGANPLTSCREPSPLHGGEVLGKEEK